MSEIELRLECLRLAVSYGTIQNIKDPVPLADTYFEWVKQSGDKRPAPRRTPLREVE